MALRRCPYGNVFPQAMHGSTKSKVKRLASTSQTSELTADDGKLACRSILTLPLISVHFRIT